MTDIFTTRARDILRRIPSGMVSTYGLIAEYAGNRRGARQVVRILYSSSEKYQLPWHRVVNRNGEITPRSSMGHLFQRQLLEEEGVVFEENGRIDLSIYLWRPNWKN
jgi:methylated-DNA-protein-cysteine methyltransferase related protein